jgi:hypothetical protein
MLEPYEVKVSRAVLGGLGGGNTPRLPDELAIKRRPAGYRARYGVKWS